MLASVSKEQLSHILLFTNSLEGLALSGISVVASFVFKDESRLAVWYAKQLDSTFAWTSCQFPIHLKGSIIDIPSYSGPLAADLLKMAESARARVKKALKVSPEKVYKISPAGVEEVSLA